MKVILFLAADLWMIFVGYRYGWRFIRQYGNYLLGLEWMVVATSGTNFLVWSLVSGSEDSPFYNLAYFFDAFSRSVGITVILVLGLMKVTHRYKPSVPVDVGLFALAIVAGLFLRHFHGEDVHADGGAFTVATFYVVINLLTAAFLAYFVKRLWDAGLRQHAAWTALVTTAATTIAITYDFFPFSFDDADRTFFYTAALATWGTQGFVYFRSYRALDSHQSPTHARPTQPTGAHS